MKNRYRIYCGPSIVKDVAHRLHLHGIDEITGKEHIIIETIGTAWVYIQTDKSKDDLLSILGRQGGWSERDIQSLRPAD